MHTALAALLRAQTALPAASLAPNLVPDPGQLPELEQLHRSVCCVRATGNEVTLKLDPRQVGIYILPGK
ncbi:MAG: hypothetical protein WCP21_07445 [Armatimonadota bacterium]